MPPSLFDPRYLQELCHRYGVTPSRHYGQHYLIEPAVIDRIIAVNQVGSDDTVVEIGPGFGTLTLALAGRVQHIVAFEIEKKVQPYWDELQKKYPNIHLIWGNVLHTATNYPDGQFGIPRARPGSRACLGTNYKVVANLPYQITSAIIRLFLELAHPPTSLTLMVQKEVGERICAEPGKMSLLSVSVQYYGIPRYEFTVPRDNFWPAPQVDSAVIHLSLRGPTAIGPKSRDATPGQSPRCTENQGIATLPAVARDDQYTEQFFRIVKAGFANRRKLLLKNLASMLPARSRAALPGVFAQLGLPATARAQELSVEQWQHLVDEISNQA